MLKIILILLCGYSISRGIHITLAQSNQETHQISQNQTHQFISPLEAAMKYCRSQEPDRSYAGDYLKQWDIQDEAFSRSLHNTLLNQPHPDTKKRLCINMLLPAAIKANLEKGIPVSVLIAQAVIESGWCQSELSQKTFNFSGMKARPSLIGQFTYWPSAGRTREERYHNSHYVHLTNEAARGQPRMEQHEFMKFTSPSAGIYSAAERFHVVPNYRNCLDRSNQTNQFIDCIAPIWAADVEYSRKLKNLIDHDPIFKQIQNCEPNFLTEQSNQKHQDEKVSQQALEKLDLWIPANVQNYTQHRSVPDNLQHDLKSNFRMSTFGPASSRAPSTQRHWDLRPNGASSVYQTRADWGAAPPRSELTALNPNQITSITLHHTVGSNNQQMRNIQAGHFRRGNDGWNDIGYNYVIGKDPSGEWKIFEGRGRYVGAHARGENSKSIGIAIMGNYGDDSNPFTLRSTSPPPKEALDLVIALSEQLKQEYPNIQSFRGHRHVGSTVCPGARCIPVIDGMNQRMGWNRSTP